MPLIRNYNNTGTKFEPPAPALQILLLNPGPQPLPPSPVEALIDSGADMTAIPRRAVEGLQLKPVDQLPAVGYDGVTVAMKDIYSVKVFIEDVGGYVIKALLSEYDFALLGRDIINRWELLLNGKADFFQIT